MKKLLKRLTAIVLSLVIVFGAVGAQSKEVEAASAKWCYCVKYTYSGKTYTKYLRKDKLKKETIYKTTKNNYAYKYEYGGNTPSQSVNVTKNTYWVRTGANPKTLKIGNKKYTAYEMQRVIKKGGVYVIDKSVYSKCYFLRNDTFKKYGTDYVMGKSSSGRHYNPIPGTSWYDQMRKGTIKSVTLIYTKKY